jgi:hypothetical protein
MFQRAFDSSYTALTPDGARFLVQNTNVKLVGMHGLHLLLF